MKMAKKYQPDRMQPQPPTPTPTLTGVEKELDEARKWQVRQMPKRAYWKLRRLIAARGLLAVYRDWKAGRKSG